MFFPGPEWLKCLKKKVALLTLGGSHKSGPFFLCQKSAKIDWFAPFLSNSLGRLSKKSYLDLELTCLGKFMIGNLWLCSLYTISKCFKWFLSSNSASYAPNTWFFRPRKEKNGPNTTIKRCVWALKVCSCYFFVDTLHWWKEKKL